MGILMIGDWLTQNYLWVKAIHIAAVISWMAGLFYLPRLFVYHLKFERESSAYETFLVMEKRLMNIVIHPASLLAIVTGLLLAFTPGLINVHSIWFLLKIVLVITLIGTQILFRHYYREFVEKQPKRTEKFFRFINEVPPLIMLTIVILVTVKPF